MVDMTLRAAQRICVAGLDSVSLRREVASRVAPLVGADAWAFGTCDPETGLMTHSVAEGVPEELARCYVEQLYPYELAVLKNDLPRNGIDMFSVLGRAPQSARALRECGMHDQVNVLLVSRGRLWGTWCLMRGDRSAVAGTRTRNCLRRLVPNLARGLRDAILIDSARAAPPLGSADDALPGVLVLDAKDRLVTRTPAARSWLDDLRDIGYRSDDGVPLAVRGLVAQLRRTRAQLAGARRLRARGRSGRLYTVSASLAEPDVAGECAATVIVEPLVPRGVPATLGQRYDLSKREREVVAAVVRGEPTKCIAAALGISPHTVAEHLDRACVKIGVRGRKALVARLFLDARPAAHEAAGVSGSTH